MRRLRLALRSLQWRAEYRRLEGIGRIGEGRRAFLVGNGPSLRAMDLAPLAQEFVCVANMGVRAIGAALPHADMHVVTDSNRYRRFAAEIEAIALRHAIPYRFLSHRMRGLWRGLPERANEPIYLVPHIDKLGRRGTVPPLVEGVLRASSVLVTAAILLEYLGFSPIYVIGCDLDYDGDGQYFYELGSLDRVHENDPKVIGRRKGVGDIDRDFGLLREAFARTGRQILNASVGGNLGSLPRADFAELFAPPVRTGGLCPPGRPRL